MNVDMLPIKEDVNTWSDYIGGDTAVYVSAATLTQRVLPK